MGCSSDIPLLHVLHLGSDEILRDAYTPGPPRLAWNYSSLPTCSSLHMRYLLRNFAQPVTLSKPL
jgi:hypothetical protein